jgi:hypothetical protein
MKAHVIADAFLAAAQFHPAAERVLAQGLSNATLQQMHVALRYALPVAIDQGTGSDVSKIRAGLKAIGIVAMKLPGLPGVKTE